MRATRRWELWPVAVAIIVRVSIWLVLPHNRFASDEDSYYRVANTLLTTGEQDVFWPPVTGWLIALIGAVVQSMDIRWIRLAWIALDAICAVLVYMLATTIAANLPAAGNRQAFARTVTLGYAVYLPAISFAEFATSEIPALLLVLLALVLLVRDPLSVARAIAVGLVLGVLSITRPSLIPLVLFLPAAAALHLPKRNVAATVAIAVLASSVVIGGVVLRNYVVAGEPTIAHNSAYNLYIGNRDLYAEDLDMFHPVATAGQIEFRRQFFGGELTYPTLTPAELQREAFRWIRDHPGEFFRRAFGRLARLFAPKTDVLELVGGERQVSVFSPSALSLLALANAQWVVVLFGGLIGLMGIYRLQPRLGVLLVATVLGSVPLCLIAISKPRYAFTFEPVLLIGVTYLLFAPRDVMAALSRRDRWIAGACALFLVWGWAAWLIFATTSRVGLAAAP